MKTKKGKAPGTVDLSIFSRNVGYFSAPKQKMPFSELAEFLCKKTGVESAAQLFLQQLATSPCCSCLPPAQLEGSGLWEGHLRQELEQV